ncbi:MAG: hemerythrin domain-containing protein [Chloroflexota bacterium]
MDTQFKPTDILSEEHREVLKILDGLDEVLDRMNIKADISRLQGYGKFFKDEIWTHFIKEEEGLFPEIEKFLPRDSGPIGVMLAEHEYLRASNDRFQDALARVIKNSNDGNAREVVKYEGQHIISTLRQHIEKEDHILFMMANMHLDKNQNEKILRVFQKLEKQRPVRK